MIAKQVQAAVLMELLEWQWETMRKYLSGYLTGYEMQLLQPEFNRITRLIESINEELNTPSGEKITQKDSP